MIEEFTITKAVSRQIDEIKQIADTGVGKNFFSRNDLLTALSSKQCFFNVLSNAENKVIGYNLNYLLPREEAYKLLNIKENEINVIDVINAINSIKAMNATNEIKEVGNLVGIAKSMSILSEYRNQGLGAQLLTYGMTELFENGADFLLASAWKIDTKIPISGIFDRLGFKFAFIKEKPWHDMDMYCPYCQSDHCTCDAAIYLKG